MISDNRIIEGCKKGNRKAYYQLYTKYASVMLGVCFRYTKSHMEAQDVLQEGFIKVFQKMDTFKGLGSFEGWIRRIMVNTAINYYKANRKYATSIEMDSGKKEINDALNEDTHQVIIEEVIPKEVLMQLIQDLPDGYRMVFSLYVFDELKHAEIADLLDISVNTTKSQLSKARKTLRQKIEAYQKKRMPYEKVR